MVDAFATLTIEECSHWSQKVLSNYSFWRKRVRGIDYYSLGISYDAYPRFGNANQEWENAILQNNQRMCGVFDGLYKKVVEPFASFFGKSIVMSDCLAVPGFNIYGPRPGSKPAFFNSVFFEYGGHIHNHPTPEWILKAFDKHEIEVPSIIHSFTIPLRLPVIGCGLNIWPSEDIAMRPCYIPYSEGIAYGFNGDLMHQVAPVRSYQEIGLDEFRITMQSHFLELKDNVIMFF